MPSQIRPPLRLTEERHRQAAVLLHRIADDLHDLSHVVYRAPYARRTLAVGRVVQEDLVDPLIAAWEDGGREIHDHPYPSANYGARRARRREPVE
jgi:hypothetical protein